VFTTTALEILHDRFHRDSLIALATTDGITPHVRMVDAFYTDGSFYVITHAQSGKMQQIARNPRIAVSGDWFTGHGTGESMGAFSAPENAPVADMLRHVFAAWLDNGHTDLNDPQTVILRIRLVDGVLFHHGTRYELRFD